MFSKKNDELLIVSIERERRDSFRIEPSSGEPLWVSIGHHRYRVKNVSAGGIGIYQKSGERAIEMGKTFPFQITLPPLNQVITGTAKVVNRSEGLYHCAFIDLSEEKREKLHLFVLERQKEQLREKKRA